MTNFQKSFIKSQIESAITTAKKDRTAYEKNMLGLMDWQNKRANAGEVFENDEKSTERLVESLTKTILEVIEEGN